MINKKALFKKLLNFLILVLIVYYIIGVNRTLASINVTDTNTHLVITGQRKGVYSNFYNESVSIFSDLTSTPNLNITAPAEVYDQSVLTIIIDYQSPTPGADYWLTLTKPMANMTENLYENTWIVCDGYSSHDVFKLYVSGVKWVNGTVSIGPYTPYVYEEHFSIKVLPRIETHNVPFLTHFVLLSLFALVLVGKRY